MSHTNATNNYELSQFVGSDKPAWLVDYNGDMLKIDTAIGGVRSDLTTAQGDISDINAAIGAEGLSGRVTEAENDITDINTKIGETVLPTTAQTLTGAIAESISDIEDTNTALGVVRETASAAQTAANGASQLAYTIANVYDSSETYAVGDYAIYQNTLYKCNTAILVGEVFDPTKWTSVKVMYEMPSGGGGTVVAQDVTYDHTSSGLSASNVQAAIDEIVADIPVAIAVETQSGTLTAGQTSVVLIFTDQTIGSTTFIDWYVSDPTVNPTAIATTSTTITFTFEAQSSDISVGAKVQN